MCSWICQFGVLQDFIFRLFRKVKGKKQIVKQYKIPFIISNSIRVIFITITSIVSVFWAVNIIDTLNPFNIFNPTELKLFGLIFILSIVVMSIFVYRPWCSLFCPYGLLSWLFEKFSVYKIKVDYQTCTSCNECVKSCPSDAMKAILGKYYTIPDCFSCGTCINSCTSNSIKFGKSYKNFSHSKTPDTV